jgi:D-3-phosphoglycerate dehydrogenase
MSLRVAVTTSSFGAPDSAAYRLLNDAEIELVVSSLGRKPTAEETIQLLDGAAGVIAGTGPLDAQIFDAVPTLRVISRVGVGVDSIDLASAQDRGITVLTTPGPLTDAVAELTIGLMLAVLRRIPEADRSLRGGAWAPLMGGLLGSRRVGIIGLGRIGSRVAELAEAFGAVVVASDPLVNQPRWPLLDVDQLVATSDIVTLHVPLVDETRNLLDRERLQSMPAGSIVVNAARGGLLDEVALLDELNDGRLSGAALDCFEEEPYTGPLLDNPSIVLTSHMGSYAAEARDRMEVDAAQNLLHGLRAADLL